MPALRLSYLHLPIKLRQCFAYCAIFPKDEIIRKQYLIELWMANGFISTNERLDAEDVGDTVWNELYWRSFFQDIEMDEFGQVTCFKMHDLVHDLAQSVAEDVCCITDDRGITTLPERIHHISDHTKQGINSTQLYKVESLRSYIYCHYSGVFKCYSLRVLGFTGSKILSSSIGDLKCLRYLNLSDGGFETLPESLCKLWNLQILILDHCQHLLKLPNSLIRLKALQHLSLKDCNKLSSLPPQIGKLTSLRILSKYFVGNERGFHLAELGPLKLKGDLEIKHLGKVKSVKDAKEANMSSKQLNKLWLLWDKDNNEESELQDNVEEILQVLQPDTQQLQYLRVEGYKGVNFSQWMTSTPSLKYLTRLELTYCKSLHLPALGKLPSLKKLWIFDMIRVKYLFEESCDGGIVFMALENLSLMYMPTLISLSREDGEIMFPRLSKFTIFECCKFSRLSREDGKNKFLCLSRLDIAQCPELLGLPSLPSINDLSIKGKCKKDLLSSIHKLSSLESLWIEGNEELTCFPDGMLQNLTSLKKLDLHKLSKLEVFQPEMINLNSMQELSIWNCNKIELCLQGLHSIKKLKVLDCHKFIVSAGFQSPACLEELSIERCKEVEGMQEALQHMICLKELTLTSLPNLESLPDCFGNLPLLHRLTIYGCSKLRCLPTSLSLSNLQHLNILRCPELGKRCEKDTGEDWPKIAHISHIIVSSS